MSGQRENKTNLLVICGPTASGKTRLSIDLAKALGGEIVSADSMQIYRGMDIGTAKPTAAEKAGIPHHLLDVAEPGQEFSLVEYLELARAAVADISARGRLPLLVGGTGLYLHSLVDNIQFQEIAADPALRRELEELAAQRGGEYLLEQLRECDPELAQKLHPNNQGRIIRALEVFRLTGTPMSELQRRSRLAPSPYNLCMLGLCFQDRQSLYRRIDQRVDEMLAQGLLDEVRRVSAGSLSKTAAQAIGYKELFDHIRGEGSLEDAVELIKLRSRRYAKRQLTWLRRDERINWLEWERFPHYQALLDYALELARSAFATEERSAER